MGRKPTRNLNLPPRMRARKRGDRIHYYYDKGGKPRVEIPLGSDYVLAVQAWSKLHQAAAPVRITVAYVITKYLASPQYQALASGTQADYGFALANLREDFGSAPIEEVRPSHVQGYLEKRSAESEHRAMREVAILGMIYRYAMAHDWVGSNPVAPIRRKRLPGRKAVYIEDDAYSALYEEADQPLRDCMDMAYLTGQRPADVLKMSEADIRAGILTIRQAKTGAPVAIRIEGDLSRILDRIMVRKRSYPVRALALLVDERGRPMTKAKLRGRFEKARAEAGISGENFQFRDLRAKAATDMRALEGIDAAQRLAGHASVVMTEHYTRSRRADVSSAIPKTPAPNGPVSK